MQNSRSRIFSFVPVMQRNTPTKRNARAPNITPRTGSQMSAADSRLTSAPTRTNSMISAAAHSFEYFAEIRTARSGAFHRREIPHAMTATRPENPM